jgi:hypothetical protein
LILFQGEKKLKFVKQQKKKADELLMPPTEVRKLALSISKKQRASTLVLS